MSSIIAFLAGKKTYIVGILTIALGLLQGSDQMVLQGLSLMTLRAAISQ